MYIGFFVDELFFKITVILLNDINFWSYTKLYIWNVISETNSEWKINFEIFLKKKRTGQIRQKNGPSSLLFQLFDYLATFMHRFMKKRNLLNTAEPIPMGFTFAFPCQRLSLTKAVLLRWTKNMHCDGVVDEEVVGLLEAAIKKKGVIIDCMFILCLK